MKSNNIISFNKKFSLRNIMLFHSIFSFLYGSILVLSPHGFYQKYNGDITNYNYLLHESSRLYGCLTLGIAWLVYSTRNFNEPILIRALTEAFTIAFLTQGLVMLRVLYTNYSSIRGYSRIFHILIAMIFLFIGGLYLYIRFTSKLRDFDLPEYKL